jgi:hypothetical protein
MCVEPYISLCVFIILLSPGFSIFIHVAWTKCIPFKALNTFPMCEYAPFVHLFICWCIFGSFPPLIYCVKWQYKHKRTSVSVPVFSFFDICLRVQWLGHTVWLFKEPPDFYIALPFWQCIKDLGSPVLASHILL